MNINNEEIIEPGTELGLALGYANQLGERRLMSNDSGAGANAGSGIHMTFLATNPLSELVWSPLKGPSNVALLPAQGIAGRNFAALRKSIDGEDFLTLSSCVPFQMKGQAVGRDASEVEAGNNGGDAGEMSKASGGSVSRANQIEEIGEGRGNSTVSDSVEVQALKTSDSRENQLPAFPGQVSRKRADISSTKSDQPKPDDTQIEQLAESSNCSLQQGFVLTSELNRVRETKARSGKCIEKMESTSENDLHKHVRSAANETAGLELSREVKGGSRAAEEWPPANRTVLAKRCPSSAGRAQTNRRKGKEKALSDGDLDGMMSRDEDDSHESVESCNSARSFAAGKRRRDFEDDIADESKGFKKQMHCVRGPTSIGRRQDSSFMNWISNMMKGFSQSAENEAAPIPLSIVHPGGGQENPDKRLVAFDKNQEPGSRVIGFQSIFQSLYCAKADQVQNVEFQVGEGSKEVKSSNKTSNNESTLQLNERFDESASGNGENLAIQPKIQLDELACSSEKGNANSENYNTKGQLVFSSKGKEATSSNSSLGKRKLKSAEQVDSEPPSAGKTTSKFCHRNDSLGSFWITRFSPKTPGSYSYPDHLNQSASLSPKPSAECLNLVPHAESHVDVRIDGTAPEGRDHSAENPLPISDKELNNTSPWMKSHDDQMSLDKLIPVLPFPVVKHSSAVASVFARRLDALKNITSSRVINNVICYFCGVKGHNLWDCSEIAEVELEELVRNLDTYSGVEEPHCLCIRCFQNNHWAIACPKASSTKRLLVESNASFGRMQITSGNKEYSTVQNVKDGICEGDGLRTKALLNWKVDETVPLGKNRCSTSPFTKHIASSSVENTLKENQIVPLALFVNEQNSDVPKGLFDAVRGLRLSRSDILKWVNSRMSVSHIEGFFLRLRLGKWEEGLGGTGYHVARIIGTQKENKEQDTKRSIVVNVGGMKCSVESRYVSNNDFLEDELMAWWSITSRNGDKIPSEEELRTKVQTKRMLGF